MNLDEAREQVRLAKIILARATGFEPFPGGYEDTIVCGSLKHNRDGSVTVDCTINVFGDGRKWETTRKLRLEKAKTHDAG